MATHALIQTWTLVQACTRTACTNFAQVHLILTLINDKTTWGISKLV